MNTKRVVKLGQKVFVLSATGEEVVRSMIGEVRTGDEFNQFKIRYKLLNGYDGPHHWFTFKEALAAAQDRINAHATSLRKQLAALRQKSKQLDTEEARQAVMETPYKVINLDSNYDGPRRAQTLKKIAVPSEYPEPGTSVYVVITPQVRLKFEQSEFYYRHFPFFVLETVVRSVCFSPDGKVNIDFETPFMVDKYFMSRKEADSEIASYRKPGTAEAINFVSHQKERDEIDSIPDLPF